MYQQATVNIPFVHEIERVRLDWNLFHDNGVMNLAFGKYDERLNRTSEVHKRVHLDTK
jgi:hypothetical protein